MAKKEEIIKKSTKTHTRINGKRLAKLRKEKGLTQQEFAERIGVSLSSVQNWEYGIKNPSPDHVEWIAGYYACTPSYIQGYSDYRTEEERNEAMLKDLAEKNIAAMAEDAMLEKLICNHSYMALNKYDLAEIKDHVKNYIEWYIQQRQSEKNLSKQLRYSDSIFKKED